MALTDSLISWWDLEEASGTRSDAHGTNDLTDNNTVGSEAGKVGDCATFVASNSEYLSTNSSDLEDPPGDFHVAFWLKVDSAINQNSSSHGVLAAGYTFGDRGWFTHYIDKGFGAELRFALRTSSGGVEVVGSAQNYDEWHLVECYYDSVNGEVGIAANNSSFTTKSAGTGGVRAGQTAFKIGEGPSFHLGEVDSVGFWQRILTSSERDELWNSGSGVAYSDISGGQTIAASLTEGASAGETYSVSATLRSSITEGTSAGDSLGEDATLLTDLTEGALSGETVSLIATLTAAISEGADAGDQWAQDLIQVVSQTEGAAAGDTFSAAVLAGLVQAAITEGTDAGETFATTLTALAQLTEGAAVGDTMTVIGTLLTSITEGVTAGETLIATVTSAITLTEGAVLGDTYSSSVISGGAVSDLSVSGTLVNPISVSGTLVNPISVSGTLVNPISVTGTHLP